MDAHAAELDIPPHHHHPNPSRSTANSTHSRVRSPRLEVEPPWRRDQM